MIVTAAATPPLPLDSASACSTIGVVVGVDVAVVSQLSHSEVCVVVAVVVIVLSPDATPFNQQNQNNYVATKSVKKKHNVVE